MAEIMRVAVIGGWGHQALQVTYGKTGRCVAIAGDGVDEEAKKYCARPWGTDVPYFDDWQKMLDEIKPEVLSLGTQPSRSAPYIVAALKRGIHVVSDKPLANSDAELKELRALTRKNPKLHLLTEFPGRMGPAFLAMREAIRSGKIGDVILVTGQKSYRFGASRPDFYRTRDGFPGIIMYVSSHIIDVAYWVTGLKYTAALCGVQGNIARKDYGQFEDHAAILLQMEKGVHVAMHMDYLRPDAAPTHGDDRLRIAGSKGVIEVRDEKCVLITREQPPTELAVGCYDEGAGLEMVETIRGRGRGIFSTAESLYMAEVLLKARECADSGKPAKIA